MRYVSILNHKYKIRLIPNLTAEVRRRNPGKEDADEKYNGICDNFTCLIGIEKTLPYDKKKCTFMHECLEAMNTLMHLEIPHDRISVLGMVLAQALFPDGALGDGRGLDRGYHDAIHKTKVLVPIVGMHYVVLYVKNLVDKIGDRTTGCVITIDNSRCEIRICSDAPKHVREHMFIYGVVYAIDSHFELKLTSSQISSLGTALHVSFKEIEREMNFIEGEHLGRV